MVITWRYVSGYWVIKWWVPFIRLIHLVTWSTLVLKFGSKSGQFGIFGVRLRTIKKMVLSTRFTGLTVLFLIVNGRL